MPLQNFRSHAVAPRLRESPIIEGELKLTGNDLHDFHILWHMHLPPGQIKGPLPGMDPGQINPACTSVACS